MKANRLLSELMLLQARGRVSTRELAERMEISQRTAHRDMEALCGSGVPLIAIRGAQGGWELPKGWRTQVPALEEDELRAMMMAQSTPLIPAAERALNKILAAMPGSLRTQADSIRARLHIDPEGWGPWSEDLSALPAVQEAVARDRKLRFDYTTRDDRAGARTVEPLGLVCKRNNWYLVANGPSGLRTYRVSRMKSATVLAESFERPSDFDLAACWKRMTAELDAQRQPFIAVFALSPTVVARFGKWHPMEPVRARSKTPHAWAHYRLRFDDEGQALFVALGLGSGAEIVEPVELRQKVRREMRKALTGE